MLDIVHLIKKEHAEMKSILSVIESSIGKVKRLPFIKRILKEFRSVWNNHEKREEELFRLSRSIGKPMLNETMLLEEHRQLSGHWKVLEEAMQSRNMERFRVALDTDGRMLIGKFREHIAKEDELLAQW